MEYRITSSQMNLLNNLLCSIEQNHHLKNEIYKILWAVLDQKIVPSETGETAARHDTPARS